MTRGIVWPPLIVGAKVSRWVRLRDVVLTLLAWLLLAWLMRETLDLASNYLSYPMFEFTDSDPPDWLELWSRLQPFSKFIAALVLWLLFWALVRSRRMRTTLPEPQPAPLALGEHAAMFGLQAQDATRWPVARILVVHFRADGGVSHADVSLTDTASDALPPNGGTEVLRR